MTRRDESGRFTPKTEASYGYYSKLLKKPFDSLVELKAAEDEYNKAHEAEIVAKEARKADAEAVKAAIMARVEAEAVAQKTKTEAYKDYLKACDEANALITKAKTAENKALTDFCAKHPEGFHDTIQIGDASYRYNYSTNATETSLTDTFVKLLNWF